MSAREVALERQNAALRERLHAQERLMDEHHVGWHDWPLPPYHPLGYYYAHPYRPWLAGVNVLGLGVGVGERRPVDIVAVDIVADDDDDDDVICGALAPSRAELQRAADATRHQ